MQTNQFLFDFFPLVAAIIAMLMSQGVKLLLFLFNKNYTFSINSIISAGGMPSTHSALITTIAISIGLKNGFNSTEFFLAIILALVVIYDARGIRHSVGEHAKVINKYLIKDKREQVNEFVGHTLLEVVAGIILGIITALTMYKLIIF